MAGEEGDGGANRPVGGSGVGWDGTRGHGQVARRSFLGADSVIAPQDLPPQALSGMPRSIARSGGLMICGGASRQRRLTTSVAVALARVVEAACDIPTQGLI